MSRIDTWLLLALMLSPLPALGQDANAAPSKPAAQPAPTVAPATVAPNGAAAATRPVPSTVPAAAKSAPAGGAGDVVLERLNGSDPAAVRAAIETLQARGGAPAQQALITRVQAGLPPALTIRAVDALVELKSARATPVLLELLQHRRGDVRLRALLGVAALSPRGTAAAENGVIGALEDPAPEVRSAAAQACSGMRLRRALPALLFAYDHGLLVAASAIGALAGPANVDALIGRIADGALEPLIPAFDGLLVRADFPLKDKLELVRKLGKVGSPSAQRYLLALVERMKPSSEERLKQELAAAVQRAAPPVEVAPAPRPEKNPALAAQAGQR